MSPGPVPRAGRRLPPGPQSHFLLHTGSQVPESQNSVQRLLPRMGHCEVSGQPFCSSAGRRAPSLLTPSLSFCLENNVQGSDVCLNSSASGRLRVLCVCGLWLKAAQGLLWSKGVCGHGGPGWESPGERMRGHACTQVDTKCSAQGRSQCQGHWQWNLLEGALCRMVGGCGGIPPCPQGDGHLGKPRGMGLGWGEGLRNLNKCAVGRWGGRDTGETPCSLRKIQSALLGFDSCLMFRKDEHPGRPGSRVQAGPLGTASPVPCKPKVIVRQSFLKPTATAAMGLAAEVQPVIPATREAEAGGS